MKESQIRCLCDYMEAPTGTGANPCFSWGMSGRTKAWRQESYRIRLGKDDEWNHLYWDSGEVRTSQSANIRYAGLPLQSGTRYFYQITIMDNESGCYQSDVCSFVTGILEEQDWDLHWIGAGSMKCHSFLFRHELHIATSVRHATAFVASPNYYYLSLNGEPCADTHLNNAPTDYAKSIMYETYLLDDKLQMGLNVLGLELGNGWYAMDLGERQVCKAEHLFALMLRIEYEDGIVEWVKSDRNSWYYTEQAPAVFNNIYHGEVYDARLEIPGWNCPWYDMTGSGVCWQKPFESDPPGGVVKSQELEPIRIVEMRKPENIILLADGSCIVDVGQNHAGWLKICARGAVGTEMTLEYTELINPDGTPNRISLKRARATDKYIFKGEGIEVYQPLFTYHGYRYVHISGLSYCPSLDDMTDCIVHTDARRIGFFESSSESLNQLYRCMVWSERSNIHGLPTDCPQRDERLGWLNDMTVRSECALYNYRLPQLYRKWIEDIKEAQGKVSGAICDTAPFYRMGQKPADPVSTSFLLTAWNVYCHYGDIRILADNFNAFERWADYLKRHSEDGIVSFSHMGDWAAPVNGTDAESIGAGAVSKITPAQLMATGYQYYNYCLLSKMAKVLGQQEATERYYQEADYVKKAFRREYYNADSCCYAKNSQASNTFPLYLNMVETEDVDAVMHNLVYDIVENNHGHMTTGNLCSRYIIEVLLSHGEEDLAYQLLTQPEYPGWGYMFQNGATTIWERWENITREGFNSGMASHNHPMNGAAAVVLHKYFAGIQPKEEIPGFAEVIIKPVVPQGLDWINARLDTIRGTVGSKWCRRKDGFSLRAEIPFNTSADVYVPRKHWPKATCSINRTCGSGAARLIREEAEYYVYRTTAGVYEFHLVNP